MNSLSTLQGYVTKDRRAPHRIQMDEEIAQKLREQNLNGSAPPESEEQKPALLLGDLQKVDRDFQTVMKCAEILMDINEPLQASEMLAECITLLATKSNDRSVH